MNFFELQHQARRKTGVLVVYFTTAVVLIVVAVNALTWVAMSANPGRHPVSFQQWMGEPGGVWITLAVLGLIMSGTLYTSYQLRGGGRALADMVGARRISSGTEDVNERRLMNVVEEMSIASGTPVPAVYVMDNEPGINAFVAGYRPTETVLVATRGALESLDRDELQGVIGHEYSHVLNGDMRINLRLMGILAGILLIAQFGRLLMRSSGRSRGRGGGQAVLIGLGLFVIGYIGVIFGSLIKAAVSRQRELLADASSVQFTRNPDGIAGALWKIREHEGGSLLNSARADDVSHFCFGDSVTSHFGSLMATHPPLEERIKLVNPTFMARMRFGKPDRKMAEQATTPTPAPVSAQSKPSAFISQAAVGAAAVAAAESIGRVTPEHVNYAQTLHKALPQTLLDAVHEGTSARCAVYALVLAGTEADQQEAATKAITQAEGADAARKALQLVGDVNRAGRQARLAILNLAMPALKEMPPGDRDKFLVTVETLTRVDQRYTVFEFALYNILREHLSEDAHRKPKVSYFKYEPVLDDIRMVLSVLARVGAEDEQAAEAAYRKVMVQFDRNSESLLDKSKCTFNALGDALGRLNELTPMLKQSVIQACADCILDDGKVLPAEAELLQAIALCLDCPMPPLMV